MQISSLLSRQSDPAISGQRSQPVETIFGGTPKDAVPNAANTEAAANDAARRITAAYDVTNITPRQLSEMLQKLHQAGSLSDQEYQDISGIRADLENAGIGSDERIDLTEFCAERLQKTHDELQTLRKQSGVVAGDGQIEAVLQRRLDWVQKCATLHDAEAAPKINALA
jgi:hypothetical protein